MDVIDHFSGFALGIRFRVNFKIESWLGEIVDSILFAKGRRTFSPKVFPEINNGINSKTLINRITNSSLMITNSDIVLDINFLSEDFQKQRFDQYLQDFQTEVLKEIRRKTKIEEIERVGLIQRYLVPGDCFQPLLKNLSFGDTDGFNELNLLTQRRLPTIDAKLHENTNDFTNVITQLTKSPSINKLGVSVDYQSYYDPPLADLDEVDIPAFLQKGQGYISANSVPWLNARFNGERKQ